MGVAVGLLIGLGIDLRFSDKPEQDDFTDTERLRVVGMLWRLEWPLPPSCPSVENIVINDDYLVVLKGLRKNAVDVGTPTGADADSLLYNIHQELESEFQKAGGWNIQIGEMELVRDRVERWRESYATWVRNAEEYAQWYSDNRDKIVAEQDLIVECQYKFDTIAHRGRRALNHIDAILD